MLSQLSYAPEEISQRYLEATPGFEPRIRVLQTRALPLGYVAGYKSSSKHKPETLLKRMTANENTQNNPARSRTGADDGARTRYLNLGKVALYQMSYIRIWCLRAESNHRHGDFQSPALPTELQMHLAIRNGIEPSTSSVTG